jgi:hypothetical protein
MGAVLQDRPSITPRSAATVVEAERGQPEPTDVK